MDNLITIFAIITLFFNSMSFSIISAEEGSLEQKEVMVQEVKFRSMVKEAQKIVAGDVSISYEVPNADGGYISSGKGDAGGKSYGISQFTSKGSASANSFVEWLISEDLEFDVFFVDVDNAGTESFDNAWKNANDFNSEKFTYYQKKYTMDFYVSPFIEDCKKEIGINFNDTLALRESAYSLAVQFGRTGALTIVKNSEITANSTEEEVIKLLYSEKRNSVGTYKFLGCSQEVRNSVYNRFINEEQDILDIQKNNPYNLLVSYSI